MSNKLVKNVCALVLFSAFSVMAQGNLVIVQGVSNHTPDLGVEPPSQDTLIAVAKDNALRKLDGQNNFLQVSEWKVKVNCKPMFRGSNHCYEGNATATASFVAKTELTSPMSVTTTGEKHWHRTNERDDDSAAMNEAFQLALADARFFCNANVVMPASDESRVTKAGVMEWQCMSSQYQGTFQCMEH